MSSARQLTRRIKSVSNISKITKAMEMVAASKMRQAQIQALASRAYSRKLDDILTQVSFNTNPKQHPLLSSQSETNKQAIVVISTDRGLTGSLNTNLFKSILKFQIQNTDMDFYTVGKLAKDFTLKSDFNLVAEFGEVGDKIEYEQAVPISKLLTTEFLNGKYSTIWISYMDFISTLVQKPRITQLLPLQKQTLAEKQETGFVTNKEYLFEPDPKTILDWILPYYVELKVYQSLLEARASEHSARMVAMKSASDNATQLADDLTLVYNRSRQASITSELSDIVTATMTLGGN